LGEEINNKRIIIAGEVALIVSTSIGKNTNVDKFSQNTNHSQ